MSTGMPPSFLRTLHCPFCGSDIELVCSVSDQSEEGDRDAFRYGSLKCACSRYPVVEGIPILQHTDGLGSVVDYIEKHELQRALLQTMNLFRVKWAHRTRWHQLRYHFNCRRLVSSQNFYFQDALSLVRKPKVFAEYLFHRYANPSFLAGAGVLQLLEFLLEDSKPIPEEGLIQEKPSKNSQNGQPESASSDSPIRIIDLACGAGHSSFLINYLYPDISVVAVDSDFVSLYLAKRFMAPNAVHVCADAEVPSPFADNFFSAVFCLDAFHYFLSKKAILAELNRILTSAALWMFPHLHNALQHNLVAGVPLDPEKYLECFSFIDARLFDEMQILHGLSERRVLDLETEASVSQLNNSKTLIAVGGQTKLWRRHHGFPSLFCRDRTTLVTNPIYRIEELQENFYLTLIWPNPVMKEECSAVEAILPSKYQLSKSELGLLLDENSPPNDERLSELASKFILVPLPSKYKRN